MFNQEKLDKYLAEASIAPGLVVETSSAVLFPYHDVTSRTTTLASAFYGQVKMPDGTEHVCVLSYAVRNLESVWSVWCGDKFFEAKRFPRDEAKARVDEAVKGLPNKAKLADQVMANYGVIGRESDRCSFWKTWRESEELCVHTKAFLAQVRDTVPNYQSQLETLYEAAYGGTEPTTSDTYELDELAFKVPVLFEGERGSGKTVTARAFARQNGYKRVECPGNEGVEAPDLLGYLVPYGPGQMVWKDGAISEAFRAAKREKVVLILDELLRIPTRQLSVLLTALSPDDGVLRLRTGRIVEVVDGVGREEELECPAENLCVVATTNIGSEYAVDDIDPALQERFVILRKDTTEAELRRILGLVVKRKKLPTKAADQCVTFFKKMVEARNRGLVRQIPTTRTLARALELASTMDDVKRGILTQRLLWVARTAEGHPVEEQLTDVQKLIDRCFK